MSNNSNNGKVVVVTGASSGIGWAVARLAARRGYTVVLNARREERLRELAAEIESRGGRTLVVAGNIAALEDQRRLVDETVKAFGRIDVLVNNAGLPLPTSFSDTPPEELRRQWDVNVTALATLTRLAFPYLRKVDGHVINIGSSISRFPVPGMGNYAPTKIAVAGLTEALRRELAPLGVDVSLVEPGPITTEFTERAGGTNRGGKVGPFRMSLSAEEAARPIVALFKRPRRRIVVPGWMGPLLFVSGVLIRVATPLVDAAYQVLGKRRNSMRP